MAAREHRHAVRLRWTGAGGTGTTGYAAYGRDHVISAPGKPDLLGSSDPAFRGDPARWSPEELVLAALSACHQLWYLHLCAEAGVVVLAYQDDPEAILQEQQDGAGQLTAITLRPVVTIAQGGDRERALALHTQAGSLCFVARSMNVPVRHAATVAWAAPTET
jgi:organic hydroperoxide reductase OsmC/OhrA